MEIVALDLENKSVQIRLPGSVRQSGDLGSIQKLIEDETGIGTVLKGMGSISSSVAELHPLSSKYNSRIVRGIIRLSQLDGNSCFVDGTISGLRDQPLDEYSLAIHEYGDVSGEDGSTIGKPILNLDRSRSHPSLSDLVQIHSIVPNCYVPNMIGRSIAISQTLSSRILSVGIIARASTVDGNKKQICTCSGKTIWDERAERKRDESF